MNLNPNNIIPPMYVDGMPIGSITAYGGNGAPPAGWLWLRKAKLKKNTYAVLYGILGDVFNDGSQASDEFMLPDAEGYFLRNFDNAGTQDPGRVFGSKQADDLKSHTHGVSGAVAAASGGVTGAPIPWSGSATWATGPMGGTETRPKNIALNYIIKASVVYTQQQLMAAGQQFTPNAATESTAGYTQVALQSEVNAGTDDFKTVTSKKLRAGFAINSTSGNGYITFPSWLGGLIIQWGSGGASPNPGTPITLSYPLVFPTACRGVYLTRSATGIQTDYNTFAVGNISANAASVPVYSQLANSTFYWLAIGS